LNTKHLYLSGEPLEIVVYRHQSHDQIRWAQSQQWLAGAGRWTYVETHLQQQALPLGGCCLKSGLK
jgi:hypothetical protein